MKVRRSSTAVRLLIHSPAILPVLDPVHGLRQPGAGVFLHRCPQAVPCGLCLGPGPNAEPARVRHREGQGGVRPQQHRRDQDDSQQAAGLRQNPLSPFSFRR